MLSEEVTLTLEPEHLGAAWSDLSMVRVRVRVRVKVRVRVRVRVRVEVEVRVRTGAPWCGLARPVHV